tara:strand:+ start:358724 stop:359725 length:1002 start_codon:yes stop_codon:yes gene_type:complete
MRALCLAVAFVTALLTVTSTQALADDGDGIAVLALDITGDATSNLRKQVVLAIVEGLEEAGDVLSVDESRSALVSETDLIDCFSRDCLERIGDSLSVPRFVRAELSASGAHYILKLQLLHTGRKRLLNSVTVSCAVCTVGDLKTRTIEAARQLLIVELNELVPVTIASIPEGAMISIDGLGAGTSPVVTKLEPGPHRFSATKDGYATTSQTAEIAASEAGTQRLEIAMVQAMGAPETGNSKYGYWKWGSVAASGTLLVLGTTLIIIDDDPACGSSTEQCRFLRQTKLGGVLSIAGSLAAGAAAGWMFWSESKSERPILSLVPGGAQAGFAFDF